MALHRAGFKITEIVSRDLPRSLRKARQLTAKVGAQTVTACSASLDATVLWFCVPDREIHNAAKVMADRLPGRTAANQKNRVRYALHSSGALLSRELNPLRQAGAAIASVHPLMTFVPGVHPSLDDVPFAIEGDEPAVSVARNIVRALGGESFSLPAKRKAAYHAWATLTSPLLLAFLVTLEQAALAAGLTREDARRKSLPIIRQTLSNYSRLGPSNSFSGPLLRGDVKTVAKHLSALKKHPGVSEVYVALARAALRGLPARNKKELVRLLRSKPVGQAQTLPRHRTSSQN
jgi:predicted short-subunit dehydrogenase-like oxidoreductase (DUF2520 family)